ncbi:PadR family transcriptional regulator [Planotetraspora sp. A-T 1434]|uniref:PadR family transcriptional regulator n=1 Tax=Planotetraspora sp. A-T 1434 TaxID=2979219 RepID=UPI0021C176DD|nr:PadR family transcriptional regulator [Planotetraspora sp. A-T 1434]MCT9929351.1 PadR family transcriptional regulator [Planotetraspora sp. A-T 1434]
MHEHTHGDMYEERGGDIYGDPHGDVWMVHAPFPPRAPFPPPPMPPLPPIPPLPPVPPSPPHFSPRVRRGDVRVALLALLSEEPRNGYQMIEEISRRSGGIWRPSPGSVYPALQQLEDEGLVRSEESGGSRTYRLTEEGRRHADASAEPWAEVARSLPEDRHELRMLWGQLGEAFVHLTHVADDRQVAETKKLLKETRKTMFRILAEDGG